MRNRRKSISEINLTPLLDVLFSILFIVMMTGLQNEQGIKSDYQDQVNQLTQEKSDLAQDLRRSENELNSYKTYQSEAVIITINNIVRNGTYYLMFYQGTDKQEIGSVPMGTDKLENIKARINALIMELVDGADNQPVYIIFYCDRLNIHTSEYGAVCNKLNELQENNKEVFFKEMKEETK